MAVVDISKNFLYYLVRPAFWEVDDPCLNRSLKIGYSLIVGFVVKIYKRVCTGVTKSSTTFKISFAVK